MVEFINRFSRLYRVRAALRVAFANNLALDNRPFFRNVWFEREWLPITLAERINLPFCALSGARAVYPDPLLIADYVAFNHHLDKLLVIVLFHDYQLLKGYCLFLFYNANIIILFRLASDLSRKLNKKVGIPISETPTANLTVNHPIT